MIRLEVIGQTTMSPTISLSARPLLVGRAPECDVVLSHPSISRRHATLWVHDGVIHIEDLASRNGTYVEGVRVAGQATVQAGHTIRLGHHDALRVHHRKDASVPREPILALEDRSSGYQHVLGPDPLLIGSAADAGLRLPDGPARLAVVVRQGTEVWLGRDDDMEELSTDAPFTIAGHELVLRLLRASPDDTLYEEHTPWPYEVHADLNAPGGPLTSVHDPGSKLHVEVNAENRAVLLYLLARKWCEDAANGVSEHQRGWADDESVAVGVWGKDGPLKQLKVLLCRVRQELREGGLDPWFLEKRRGALRIRVAKATVAS